MARRIQANGCPNHQSYCVGKEGICVDGQTEAEQQDIDIEIMAYPCLVASPQNVTCVGETVGLTRNGGVSIFSMWGADPCVDAVQVEGDTFDHCGGHAEPQQKQYHYHVPPVCLLNQQNGNTVYDDGDTSSWTFTHDLIVGWALDGFPVYGPHGTSGNMMRQCDDAAADAGDCLDACNGHDQHEIDGFLYHYHFAGEVCDSISETCDPLPSTTYRPYTVACLKGRVLDNSVNSMIGTDGTCVSPGVSDSYVAEAMTGLTTLYADDQNPTSADDSGAAKAFYLSAAGLLVAMIV
jgi:hypothetical protein